MRFRLTITSVSANNVGNYTVVITNAYGSATSSVAVLQTGAAGWAHNGSLKAARLFHTSTLLPNGKVLVAGGQGNSGITNGAELFDSATGTWANTGAMTTNRSVHTATLLLNGKVLIAGGFGAVNAGNTLASTELFDPVTGTWTTTGAMTRCWSWAAMTPPPSFAALRFTIRPAAYGRTPPH